MQFYFILSSFSFLCFRIKESQWDIVEFKIAFPAPVFFFFFFFIMRNIHACNEFPYVKKNVIRIFPPRKFMSEENAAFEILLGSAINIFYLLNSFFVMHQQVEMFGQGVS